MADLNVDFLAEALERHRNTVPIIILLAAEAHLAHLRAPKGELEEARAMADMREWLGEEGSLRSATFSPISVKALAEAFFATAREAQVRVLEELEKQLPLERWEQQPAIDALRARLGEDL